MSKCGADTWDGGKCKQPAGFRTFHIGMGECYLHHKVSLHTARKLYNGSCMPKSIYEECALIELRDNAGVDEYYYEPTKIPYDYTILQREVILNYIPDILVTYTWKEPDLIEVKKIAEMCDSQNLAKFKSADAEARKHGCNFKIWGYESMEKSVWTYHEIFEKCCFLNHKTWLKLSKWINEQQKITITWIDFASNINYKLKNGSELTDSQKINMKKCWGQAIDKGFEP